MPKPIRIRRALISVYDKTGIVEFARALSEEFGVEIISTGGTAKVLREAGVPVTLIETITGFPEMLDGRVKTLHPAIHAAILADRDNPEHMRQLEAAGIKPIDMVVVNLYPFEKTVADPSCTFEQAIEMIDVGGVTLLRAAAKNHRHVWVIGEPRLCAEYLGIRRMHRDEPVILPASPDDNVGMRRTFADIAFKATSKYDSAIHAYLAGLLAGETGRLFARGGSPFPGVSAGVRELVTETRYGENPHQRGAAYAAMRPRAGLLRQSALQGETSFNNYVDASAALELCAELTRNPGVRDRPSAGRTDPDLWYGLPARSGVQRASSPPSAIRGETWRRRHQPHLEVPGRSYFVTFRTLGVQLSPDARDAVLAACRYWHGGKMSLHICCVMPDHVHLLMTPFLHADESAAPLAQLLHSIKSYSGNQVNRLMERRGPLWMQESWDRVMRDEREFDETWEYIETNAERAGLGADYRWVWRSEAGFEEGGWIVDQPQQGVGLEARRTDDGLEAHTTRQGAPLEKLGALLEELGAPLEEQAAALQEQRAAPTPPNLSACLFIKHTNACGVGVAATSGGPAQTVSAARVEAYRRAYLGDPNAAMGGVLAVNFTVDAAFAAVVIETFQRFGKPLGKRESAGSSVYDTIRQAPLPGGLPPQSGKQTPRPGQTPHPNPPGAFFVEVWVAPQFTDDAVAVIRGTYDPLRAAPDADLGETLLNPPPPKKDWGQRVRLLAVGDMTAPPDPGEMDIRKIAGGVLMQTPDLLGLNEDQWKVVTKRAPTEQETADLRLAWLICKHTKSNAISIVRDGMLLGNGAGQMSRVMSCRIATWLARENGHLAEGNREQGTGNRAEHPADGPVAASDAFFPFRDGPDILIDAGVTAIIQPGGSKRDADTIAACDERDVAMIFTGTRHFKH